MLDMGFNIEIRPFCHKFIVCSALKTEMILGLDFAKSHRIGIDWDDNMDPYLRTAGKYLTSAMPLKPLSPESVVHEIQAQTPRSKPHAKHTGRKAKNLLQGKKKSPVSFKPKTMIRLLTKTQVRLPPQTLSAVPVAAKIPNNSKKNTYHGHDGV